MHSRRTVVLASTAVVAATLATMLAAAVVVAPALARHLVQARGVSGSEPLSPRARAAGPLRRGETFVTVLNASGRPGAAQDAAAVLQRLGYVVAFVGNTPRAGATVVLYRRGHGREGIRLAHDLGLTAARPLAGLRPAQLLGAQLALVLGS